MSSSAEPSQGESLPTPSVFTPSAFTRSSASYDRAATIQQQVVRRLLDDAPPLAADARLLDIGCGTGDIARQARARGKTWHLAQLDLSEAMCRRAGLHAAACVGDAQALPFAAACFDAVLSSFCLQWLPHPRRMLDEARRVLKPGGALHVATLGPASLPELATAFHEAGLPPRHLSPPSLPQLTGMLREAGFDVIAARSDRLTARYPDAIAALRALHELGATLEGALPALTPAEMRRLLAAYPLRAGQAEAGYQALHLSARLPLR